MIRSREEKAQTAALTTATYNTVDFLEGKVEVGECLEVLRKGEAPFLSEVVFGFSDQIHSQEHHDGGGHREDPFQLQPSPLQ